MYICIYVLYLFLLYIIVIFIILCFTNMKAIFTSFELLEYMIFPFVIMFSTLYLPILFEPSQNNIKTWNSWRQKHVKIFLVVSDIKFNSLILSTPVYLRPI